MDGGTNDAALVLDATGSDAAIVADAAPDAFWQPAPDNLELSFGFEEGDAVNGFVDEVTGEGRFHLLNGSVVDGQPYGHALSTDNRGAIYEGAGFGDVSDELRARFTRNATLEGWINQTSVDEHDVAMSFGFVHIFILPDATTCDVTVTSEGGDSIDVDSVSVPSTTHALPRGAWTHVACTYRDGDVYLYINGRLYSGSPGNPYRYPSGRDLRSVNSPFDLRVGEGANYVGLIDELKVWSRALSPSEICSQVGGDYTEGGCIPPGGI